MSKLLALVLGCALVLPAGAALAQTPPPIALADLGPPPVLPIILPTSPPERGVGPGAINAAGHLVGFGRNAADTLAVAYFWNVAPGVAGTVTPLVLAEPGFGAQAYGINASSRVVGIVNTATATTRAAVWNPTVAPLAQPVLLPDVPLLGSAAGFSIGPANHVVGAIGNRAALWEPTGPATWGAPTILPALGAGSFARADGINARGDIFGIVFDPVDNQIHGAVWNAAAPTAPIVVLANLPGASGLLRLVDYNDAGQLVAQVFDPTAGSYVGVLYQPTGPGTWSGPRQLDRSLGLPQVRGLNSRGMIVGHAADPISGAMRALAWDASSGLPGPARALADEGGGGSMAYDINDAGSVVGVAIDMTGCALGDACDPSTARCVQSGLTCRQQVVPIGWMWPNVDSSPLTPANRPVKLPGHNNTSFSEPYLVTARGTVVGLAFGDAIAWHTLDCDDGLPCTVDAATGSTTCAHPAGGAGRVCRAAAGTCDVAEVCDGVNAACPADTLEAAFHTCRASAGLCDVPDRCTGATPWCPPDGFKAINAPCRLAAPADACDQSEVCDGVSAACPADRALPANTPCRAAASNCDVAEVCDGVGLQCPADVHRPAGTVCRAGAGPCDVEERCTGGALCPADGFAMAGLTCSGPSCGAGVATLAQTCTGMAASCPPASTQACAPFVCGADACLATCTDDVQCVAGRFCVAGACVADGGPPVVTPPPDVTAEATAPLTPVPLGAGSAVDDVDGALVPTPDRTGPFPVGVTTITWRATDGTGATGTAIQRVTITDTTPPTLTLIGAATVELDVGELVHDLGALALDLVDGDLSGAIVVNGTVEVTAPGTYQLTFTVADSRGNAASPVSRTYIVTARRDGGGGCQTGDGGQASWPLALAIALALAARRRRRVRAEPSANAAARR